MRCPPQTCPGSSRPRGGLTPSGALSSRSAHGAETHPHSADCSLPGKPFSWKKILFLKQLTVFLYCPTVGFFSLTVLSRAPLLPAIWTLVLHFSPTQSPSARNWKAAYYQNDVFLLKISNINLPDFSYLIALMENKHILERSVGCLSKS